MRATLQEVLGRAEAPQVLFGVFGLAMLVIIWGTAVHLIDVESNTAKNAAGQSTRDLIATYEAQMLRNLGTIDQALRFVKYAYEKDGKQFSLADLNARRLLPSSRVFKIQIADRWGAIATSGKTTDDVSVSDHPFFHTHRQHDTDTAFAGKATRNIATGEWILQFSRRLNAADGAFDGIAIVSVEPAYFTSGYEIASMGAQGVIGLLGQDGEFRVKRSNDDITSGEKVDYSAATSDTLKVLADGALLTNPWDGVRRYTSVRALHNFPWTAIVGLSEEEQLATFYQRRRSYLMDAAGATALLLVVMTVLARLSWQLTKSRRRVRRIQQTYYAASEAGGDALFMLRSVFDVNGVVIDFVLIDTNTRGEELTGTSKTAMLGMKLCELFPKSRTNGFLKDLAAVAETGVIHEKEWRNAMPKSNAQWLYRQVVAVEDGVVAMVGDISVRKRLETQIQYEATHDALTSLPNRHLLHDCLQSAIDDVDTGHITWVVFVDLDRFKSINDNLGHKAGDNVLKKIAERLQASTRPTDTVARLGGDEFVIILPNAGDAGVATETLQRIMDIVAVPIMIEAREFTLSCSMGIAVYPDDGQTPEILIERADIAMYSAKQSGRDNFQFFNAAMNERLIERLRIEGDLRKAVKNNEFVLHYQPQVDLATGQIVGMEALIRWQHPERGMIPPNLFIGVAEETGLICAIGDWVIRTACAQNMAWQRAGFGRLRIAVNLSARQFAQRDLVKSIAAVLEETGMDAHDLEVELTESLVMGDVESAIDVLHDLKKLGVKLSIDDFGTGYSSLSYLKRFPIDVLKIDQSFMRDIVLDSDEATIVSLIILLAQTLHLGVIAEGVETEVQLAYLRRHGCNEMQGYFFSRPVPAEKFTELLTEGKCLKKVAT